MKSLLLLSLAASLFACQSGQNNANSTTITNDPSKVMASENPVHTIVVLEVIQVENYTYLRAKENVEEIWLATPTMQAAAGDTLYYQSGMMMSKFESRELKRTFEKILFVDKISKTKDLPLAKTETVPVLPPDHAPITATQTETPPMGSTKDTVKQKINIAPVKNGVSIAEILKNPSAFNGKTVLIKGKVTKYTAGVMGKNWVHIQDGSDFNGKFEIVITTLAELKDGETVTFEGPITLNKDLGYGYFFEVLMEDAKVVK